MSKLWLWKNFVDGKPEYWAFDNPYPIYLTDNDPQTLGEPCGYALLKPSRNGRPNVDEEKVLEAIRRASSHGEERSLEGVTEALLHIVLYADRGNSPSLRRQIRNVLNAYRVTLK